MMSETLEHVEATEEQLWSQHLQRRILRLLLQHDEALFRRQFRHFFVASALPPLPLLQQYDRYIRLQTLSNELLDDILPRIRRQLSLKTSHVRLREEAPTRGDIDWPRTIERGWSSAPGMPPLQFDTRLRQRTLETPENLFTVAVLLAYQQELRAVVKENLGDEELDMQERQVFAAAEARVQRELAAPYARALLKQASQVDIDALARQITQRLRPGPYRELLDWWRRFQQFRVGRADDQHALALASRRDDEKVDAWLYELWIALEFIHLLAREEAIESHDIEIVTDALQCTFVWQQRGFRFVYNRQLDTSTTYESDWEHGPATRPDYAIERVQPLEIKFQGELLWREPPFVLDAKYYLQGNDPARTHGPLKKLLGDMTLLGASSGALFFPKLPEPRGDAQFTRIVRRTGRRYEQAGDGPQNVHLYHIEPGMELPDLQRRVRAILDLASEALPARPAPICEGIYLDGDTINNSRSTRAANIVLCPKRHIGPHAFDLVDADSDCLKNPRLCHVIGQPIVPPFVVRVTTVRRVGK
ncbi:MAG: hypothetical protein M3Y39_11825 [Chloroflexota bacterium]|nr:hypothetical protein [Chloroflexota bacterium]